MTDRKADPLASAGEVNDATGVDSGSDDWAKAVIDGLKADDARSDTARQSDTSPTGDARADSSETGDDSQSTLAPVADREDNGDVIGEEMAKAKIDNQNVVDGTSDIGSGTEDENPLCSFEEGAPVGGDDPNASSDPAAVSSADGGEDSATLSDAEVVGLDGAGSPPPPQGQPLAPGSVEDLVSDLERVTGERDTYLESSRRIQAEFENYRKQVGKRETEARERANESLVAELLPILDACDGAVANGADDVVPISTSLLEALTKQGLERLEPTDAPFDPEFHEAVMHEDGKVDGGPVVAEVMRAGYTWKGRVVRPAMVRVRG